LRQVSPAPESRYQTKLTINLSKFSIYGYNTRYIRDHVFVPYRGVHCTVRTKIEQIVYQSSNAYCSQYDKKKKKRVANLELYDRNGVGRCIVPSAKAAARWRRVNTRTIQHGGHKSLQQ